MDNKLTKSRLSAFLQYEWILMIIISVAAIILWELVYTVTGVRLTTGQQFKYYYDQSISSTSQSEFYNLLVDKGTFSYDVLSLDVETLTADYNVLSTRLSIQEGDILITDSKEVEGEGARAKSNVDNYSMYDFDKLLLDAENYLKRFLKDGVTDVYQGEFDSAKIEAHFLTRMKKDNRYRKQAQKDAGVKQEIARIEKLRREVKDFKKLLDSEVEDLFFRYTKFEQSYMQATDEQSKAEYKEIMDKQTPNARYGLNVVALKGEGKTDPSKYFKMKSTGEEEIVTADNVVIMAFDFLSYQPDLQFECISFINTVVRECSDILEA